MMNGGSVYGGLTLFNEHMAETRRPYDFWKGFICTEIFRLLFLLDLGRRRVTVPVG